MSACGDYPAPCNHDPAHSTFDTIDTIDSPEPPKEGELEPTSRKFRHEIPDLHRQSLDTRIQWLWNQRFGTVQTVWQKSQDLLDHTAATLILQAIMAKDLDSIQLIFARLEGGAVSDEQNLQTDEPDSMRL